MKIAVVTDTYEGIAGGVVTAAHFVEALRARHEIIVVATGPSAPGKVVVPGFALPLRAMHENRFTFGWPSGAILRRVLAEVDLVHVNFPFLLGLGAVRLARKMRVPTVAAFHVQPENVLLNIGLHSAFLARVIYRFWVRYFFERANGVICPSEFALQRLRSHGLSRPAWVVSNGALLRPPRPRRDPQPGVHRSVVLSLGRLAREKRQDVIIDAVARSQHRDRIRLVIAGAGPLAEDLRERIRHYGLTAEIGYLGEERLAEVLGEADLFVHASEVELEGMAVLEAMAAGLPVLVVDAPESAASAFASGRDFHFRTGDAGDLALHLDRLLDSPELLAEGARQSRAMAAQHEFHRCVRALESVYESVLAESRSSHRGDAETQR